MQNEMLRSLFGLVVLMLIVSTSVMAQIIAVVTPNATPNDDAYANALSAALAADTKLLDRSLAASAFRSRNIQEPFNLPIADAKRVAAAVGCQYLILLRSDTLRRASFSRPDYYQAFASIFVVSGRTGRLIDWRLSSFEAATAADATTRLLGSASSTSKDLILKVRANSDAERNETPTTIEEVPDDKSPAAQGLRPPAPYKRIKPEYTPLASLYNILATIEVLADISAAGEVTRTEVVRWAGFGLDESVVELVKKMNWRPAIRNSKPLPMRVLLRYNFTKIDNDQ